VRPTTWRLLAAVAVLSAVAGWAVTRLVDAFAGRALVVPWSLPVVMLGLAGVLALWTRSVRARLARRPGTEPVPPLLAARTAALALAGSRTGALVGGFFLGVLVGLAPGRESEYVRSLLLAAALTVVGSALLVLVSLWLERVCRLPDPPPGEGAP
jgi:hypothetical protein